MDQVSFEKKQGEEYLTLHYLNHYHLGLILSLVPKLLADLPRPELPLELCGLQQLCL